MLTCKKCNKTLDTSNFRKCLGNKTGYLGTCIPCINERRRLNYKNTDSIRIKNSIYQQNNKDKMIKYAATYYRKHWDKCRVARKNWHLSNPDKVAAMRAKRRAAELMAIPSWANLNEIKKFYKEAKNLSKIHGIKYEVDHIIPLRGKNVCGLHVENNLQVVTQEVNREKKNLLMNEFLPEYLSVEIKDRN